MPQMMHRDVTVDFDDALRIRRVESAGSLAGKAIGSSVAYQGQHGRGIARPLEARTPVPVRVDTVLPANAFDGLALYPMLLSRSWIVGRVDTLWLFDTDEMSITRQTARAVARETLALPTGRVTAIRVELTTTQLPVTLWLTDQTPHRLLKIASASGESLRVGPHR